MNPDAPMNPPVQQPKKDHFFWDLFKFTVGALIIVFAIRTFIAQPFIVSGLSMFPTFGDGNYLVIDELSYRFDDAAERRRTCLSSYELSGRPERSGQ